MSRTKDLYMEALDRDEIDTTEFYTDWDREQIEVLELLHSEKDEIIPMPEQVKIDDKIYERQYID